MKQAEQPRKRRGRPRKDGTQSANQREEIIDAAMRLFAQNGYANTNMSAIAREAGLDQSSLYYWFSNKEDLLKHLLEVNRATARMARASSVRAGDCATTLYGVLYNDALRLCRFPFDYYDLEAAACQAPGDFSEFFSDYQELRGEVARVIERGVAAGEFACDDPQAAAALALVVNEGVQHRCHRAAAFERAAQGSHTVDPHEAAAQAAVLVLSSLLVRGDARAVQQAWAQGGHDGTSE